MDNAIWEEVNTAIRRKDSGTLRHLAAHLEEGVSTFLLLLADMVDEKVASTRRAA